MNKQPEAAAKAAEATPDEFLFTDSLPLACAPYRVQIAAAFRQAISHRDEQITALTDKLASVTAEREEWKEKACIFESQVENADAYLEQTKLNVKAEVTTLRARVAELEGIDAYMTDGGGKFMEEGETTYDRVVNAIRERELERKEAQSELAQVRLELAQLKGAK